MGFGTDSIFKGFLSRKEALKTRLKRATTTTYFCLPPWKSIFTSKRELTLFPSCQKRPQTIHLSFADSFCKFKRYSKKLFFLHFNSNSFSAPWLRPKMLCELRPFLQFFVQFISHQDFDPDRVGTFFHYCDYAFGTSMPIWSKSTLDFRTIRSFALFKHKTIFLQKLLSRSTFTYF